ncbi:MAG: aldehyde dehydrogenase [Acidimicrobiia bacterium]
MADPIDRTTPPVHLRIGGERLTSGSGGVHPRVNPATGAVDAQVPLAGAAEVDRAVRVAHEAFDLWRRTAPTERRRLLERLAELVVENRAELSRRGTLDLGVPYHGQPAVDRMAALLRYYAGWADRLSGELLANYTDRSELAYTLVEPYGVVGIIITWNGPLASYGMKMAAPIAAGNTVVVKPSELVPFSGELLADLVEEAGFPPGVVNILPGAPEAGEALVSHALVRKVSFTGGPGTAEKILVSCARQIKPVLLELGGKSANLVFEDADLDAAVHHGTLLPTALVAGQGCAFPTRMLVQDTVYDEVLERARAAAESFVVGDPFEEGTVGGPVISGAAVERILAMVETAKAQGARLLTGGHRLGGPLSDGFFVAPTVFADVDPASELAQKEVFGPVLAVTPFRTEEEAIRIANSTPYGLAAYVSTRDLARAHRVAGELTAGTVIVNGANLLEEYRPFGGFGYSGMGKEQGRLGIEEWLRVKAVAVAP